MNKQSIVWWVAAAVAVIFLMALIPLGNHDYFQQSSVVGLIYALGWVMVASIAAMVAIYWVKSSK
jgi:hypothetical protein